MDLGESFLIHLGRLARLRLLPEEAQRLRRDLERILEYVAVLDEIDPGGSLPLSDGRGRFDLLRADEVGEVLPPGEALAAAPEVLDGSFAVPVVVRHEREAPDARGSDEGP